MTIVIDLARIFAPARSRALPGNAKPELDHVASISTIAWPACLYMRRARRAARNYLIADTNS